MRRLEPRRSVDVSFTINRKLVYVWETSEPITNEDMLEAVYSTALVRKGVKHILYVVRDAQTNHVVKKGVLRKDETSKRCM